MGNWLSKLFGGLKAASPREVEPPVESGDAAAIPWQVIGASIRGASHERSGLPNQDAIGWWPNQPSCLPLILAVADGHGSAKSFRSDRGARLAVDTALSCFRELLGGSEGQEFASLVKRSFEELLPREIERRWKAAVADDLAERPMLVNEVVEVENKQGKGARQSVEELPVLAYGTTLVAAVLHPTFVACLQLGDGDILVVDAEGQVTRPIEDDPRLFANETTSLATKDAWRDFRTSFQSFDDRPPTLILLGTDGYSNSFDTPSGFEAVGPDLLDLLQTAGVEQVREQLPGWLKQASQEGSGDDVTVGLLFPLRPNGSTPGDEVDGDQVKATDKLG